MANDQFHTRSKGLSMSDSFIAFMRLPQMQARDSLAARQSVVDDDAMFTHGGVALWKVTSEFGWHINEV